MQELGIYKVILVSDSTNVGLIRKYILHPVTCAHIDILMLLHLQGRQLSVQRSLLKFRQFSSSQRLLFKLRDYQEDAIDKVLEACERGIKRPAVVLATGGGKTVVMAHLISKLPNRSNGGLKTLVLAHKEELVRQAARTIADVNPDLEVKIDMQKLRPEMDADVFIGSVPTLVRLSRLERYDPKEFKAIILDECHHATAGSWSKILEHFGAMDKDLEIRVVGFTATLERSDGASLGTVFEEVVFERSLITMVEKKELCDVKFSTIEVDVDLTHVPTRFGDYAQDQLSNEVNKDNVNLQVARAYLQLKKEFGFKSTLVFCVDIAHCKTLCGVLQKNGINAQYVTGDTVKHERQAILQDFKDGNIDVLCNVLVFTEGTDIPNIDSLILARPTRSRPLLVQMIGRGLRLHQGKDYCHVVDVTSTTDIGILSVPTLFDLPASHRVHGKSLAELQEDKEEIDEFELLRQEEERRLSEERAFKMQQELKDIRIQFMTLDGLADLEKKTAAMYEDPGTINEKIKNSFIPWIRLEYDVWGYQLGKLFLLLERTGDGKDKVTFTLSQCEFTPLSVIVASNYKAQRIQKTPVVYGSNVQELLGKAEMAAGYYVRRRRKAKPISDAQQIAIERMLGSKFRQLYGSSDFSTGVELLSLERAAKLLFAGKYSVNALWVKWELQNMFGPLTKTKLKMEKIIKLTAKEANISIGEGFFDEPIQVPNDYTDGGIISDDLQNKAIDY